MKVAEYWFSDKAPSKAHRANSQHSVEEFAHWNWLHLHLHSRRSKAVLCLHGRHSQLNVKASIPACKGCY